MPRSGDRKEAERPVDNVSGNRVLACRRPLILRDIRQRHVSSSRQQNTAAKRKNKTQITGHLQLA